MANSYELAKFDDAWPHQDKAIESIRTGFRAGHKNQMLMAPTGAGKTYIAHRIAQAGLVNGKRVLFVCDRTTLIDQTSETADNFGLHEHGVLQSQHNRRNDDMPYQIASIQTIAKRNFWPKADLIIIDEAHSKHTAWTEYALNSKAYFIGLSATPFSKGLGKLFSNLINVATMKELTDSGVLVPMRILSAKRIDMTGAKTKIGGEWADKEVETRGNEIIGDIVKEWIAHAENRKTIIFGATIAHCEEICKQFLDVGIMAAIFTANTTKKERALLLQEYTKENSFIRILISVEALAKGFDVKDVSCIVDARPLRKSLSTAIQMWGRGLRSAPNKENCILLDHSGNIVRFMDDFEKIYYDGLDHLDDGEKLDKEPRKENEKKEGNGCPRCGHKPFVKRCISCGHQRIELSNVTVLDGKMQEISLNGKKLADNAANLWAQIAQYVQYTSQPEKQYYRAMHLYKKMTGIEPNVNWDIHNAPHVPCSKNVENKIRSLNIAYAKARKSA